MGKNITHADAKEFKKNIDGILDRLFQYDGKSGERDKAITKLNKVQLWLGKELESFGEEDCNAKRDKEELSNS